jgi:hypothetical protein
MPGDINTPILDLAKIDFPTDAVTLGQLRRRKPELLTRDGLTEADLRDLEIAGTIDAEITLAEKAFLKTLGQPYPDPGDTRGVLFRMLNQDYCELGLSTGPNQTRQLMRAIESAAVEQAKGIIGRRR